MPHRRRVLFAVDCSATHFGEHVRVVGAPAALGSWSPQQSPVVLVTSAADFPAWRSAWVELPEGLDEFEYKYVICGGGTQPRWEGRPNRAVKVPKDGKEWAITESFDSMLPPTWQGMPSSAPQETQQPPPDVAARVQAVGDAAFARRPRGGRRRASTCARMAQGLLVSHEVEMVRRRTISNLSELEGLVPTMRTLGTKTFKGGLVREINLSTLHRDTPAEPSPRVRLSVMGAAKSPALQGITPKLRGMPRPWSVPRGGPKPQGAPRPRNVPALRIPVPGGAAGMKVILERGDSDDSTTSTSDTSSVASETFDCYSSELTSEAENSSSCESEDADAHANEDDAKTFEAQYDWDASKYIGEGGFGAVFSVLEKQTGQNRAVKIIRKGRLQHRDVAMLFGDDRHAGEIAIQRSLPKHPNLVGLHSFFEEDEVVRMVMDFCSGGDLYDEIIRVQSQTGSALPEVAAASVFGQLLTGVVFLHARGIVHRDLKAENVLLAYPTQERPLDRGGAEGGNIVKLCDFGFAADGCGVEDEPALNDKCGSPDYIAPEVLNGSLYGCKVDVWAAGVVLFASLSAALPFAGKSDVDTLRKVREGCYHFGSRWASISEPAKEMVRALLVVDAARRPNAADVVSWPWLAAQVAGG